MSMESIIVGIDFGTSFSAVSWAWPKQENSINVVSSWPKDRTGTSVKVPSAISYTQSGLVDKWGFDAPENASIRCFKLLLEDQATRDRAFEPIVRPSLEFLGESGKSPVDVVADYLRRLWEHTKGQVSKHLGVAVVESLSFKVFVTVPSTCSAAARARTTEAASHACGLRDVTLVDDVEAAALAFLDGSRDTARLAVGDRMLLCNAGAVFVELATYEIQQLQPGTRLKQVSIISGGLCGSSFLDIAFNEYLRTRLGEPQWPRISPKKIDQLMIEFEYRIKRDFRLHGSQYEVDLMDLRYDMQNDATGDFIILELDKLALGKIFDTVCRQVYDLVSEQLKSDKPLRDSGRKLVVLSGGFGESGYLFDGLIAAFRHTDILTIQPTGAWSSCCRGAVVYGLNLHAFPTRLLRYSYGRKISETFDRFRHKEIDKYVDAYTREHRARNQMQWLLKRGEETSEKTTAKVQIFLHLPKRRTSSFIKPGYVQQFYYTTGPPEGFGPSVRPLCVVKGEISQWALKEYWRETRRTNVIPMEFCLSVTNEADLHFTAKLGQQVIPCEVDFTHTAQETNSPGHVRITQSSSSVSESSSYESAEETMEFALAPRTRVGQSQNKSVSYAKSKRSALGQERVVTTFAKRRAFSRKLAEIRQAYHTHSLGAISHQWPEEIKQPAILTTASSVGLPTALTGASLGYGEAAEAPVLSTLLAALKDYTQFLWDRWLEISSTLKADLTITALTYDSSRNVLSILKVSEIQFRLLRDVIGFLLSKEWDLGEAWKMYEQSEYHAVGAASEIKTGGELLALVKQWSGGLSDAVRFLRMRLQMIDLALLSHLHGHAPEINPEGSDELITIPARPEGTMSAEDVVLFQPYRLACLNGITHARKVWVFHRHSDRPEEPLYLSTNVRDFAALWGPLWPVLANEKRTLVDHYNVGGGQLFPVADHGNPRLVEGERMCHWMRPKTDTSEIDDPSSTSSNESEPDRSTPRHLQQIRQANPLTGDEILLIGTKRSPKMRWYRCDCSMSKLKSTMKGSGHLHALRSRGWFNYISNASLGVNLGAYGAGMSGTATGQTNPGENRKQGFLEELENSPQSWDPRYLMDFWGVLVSACTFNARRVRLVELLKTGTLLDLIDRYPFKDEDARTSLDDALENADPFAIVDLWKQNPLWREDLGNAILVCIRALCKTGYDTQHRIFNVLWKRPHDANHFRLELQPNEHPWVDLLKDTEDSMAMAVLVVDRLAAHAIDPCGRDNRFTTLETAIVINESLPSAQHLEKVKRRKYRDPPPWRSADKRWRYVWKIRDVPIGMSLRLPEANRLEAVAALTDTHLLVQQTTPFLPLVKEALKIKSGRRESHWEYTSDNSADDSAGDDVRPVPVHVR